MKANEFFKKHGLAEVKILLTSPSHGFFFKEDFYNHYGFDIYDDLKRLVESHELVEEYGGLDKAKAQAERFRLNTCIKMHGFMCRIIADVESCQ